MGYKPAYIWNGTSFDQIGNQAVASLNDYALLSPVVGQTITNTTLTSPTINGGTLSGTFSGTKTISGTTNISGTATISAATTHSGNLEVTGRLDTFDIRESVTEGTISSNVLTVDYSVGTINFIGTSPTANFTVNVTNLPTDNAKVITIIVMVNQGATGYIPNALQIAGVGQTIRWSSGNTPTPTSTAGKIDIFNFSLIRRSSAWTVLGNAALNF